VTVRGGEASLTVDKGHLFVQARVDGQGPFWLVLDTGSQATFVSSEIAARLRLSGYHQAVVTAIGGSRVAGTDTVRNVEVGTAWMSALPVLIGASNGGSSVDGVLGDSFLRTFRVTIDYSKLLVTFTPP